MSLFKKKGFVVFPVIVLLGLTVILFGNFIGSADLLISRVDGDVASLYYYWRDYGFSLISQGIIPFWNPNVFTGVPFAAYSEAAVFYPPNLIFLIFPTAWAINLSFAGHFLALALFQYLFLRSCRLSRGPALAGSITLGLSAPVILHIYAGHLSNICTMAWIPALFWLAHRTYLSPRRLYWSVFLGLFGGIAVLAGHWQYLFYALVWLVLFLMILLILTPRKNSFGLITLFFMSALIGVGISAPQLLLSLDLAPESFRTTLGYEWAANFSFPPLNLITLLSPEVLGDSITGMYWGRFIFWEMNAYFGFLPLLLIPLGIFYRRDRLALIFLGLAVLSFLVALGSYTPLFGWLYRHLPGFNYMRGSAKALFLGVFFLSFLVGRGVEGLSRGFLKNVIFRKIGLFLCLAGISLVAVSGLITKPPAGFGNFVSGELLRGRHHEFIPPGQPLWWEELVRHTPPQNWERYTSALTDTPQFIAPLWALIRRALLRGGVVSLILGLILFSRHRQFRQPVLVGLIVLELFLFARSYIVGFDPAFCSWDPGLAEFFQSRGRPFRYASFDPLDYNRGMLTGFQCLTGHQADTPVRVLRYLALGQTGDPDAADLSPEITRGSALFSLANLRYYILPAAPQHELPGMTRVFLGQDKEVWELKSSPRVLIVPRARIFRDPEKILIQLSSGRFNPAAEVFLEQPLPGWFKPGRNSVPGKIEKIEDKPNYLGLELEVEQNAIILVNDAWDQSWQATVDGKVTQIYRANYIMRAIPIPPGRHRVEFFCSPPGYDRGIILVLITLSLIISWWLARRWTQPGFIAFKEEPGN